MDLLSTCNKDALNIIYRYIHRFYLTKVFEEFSQIPSRFFNWRNLGNEYDLLFNDWEDYVYHVYHKDLHKIYLHQNYLPKNYQYSGISDYSIEEFLKNK